MERLSASNADVSPMDNDSVGVARRTRVWITMAWEPLPGVDASARLLRCGLLARQLAADGHHVTWWTSTFDHPTKTNRFDSDRTIEAEPNLRLELLHGPGYRRNISVRRISHNRVVARAFLRRALLEHERPDVIFTVLPTIELAEASAEVGRRFGIPVIVDVQDLWPDIFLNAVPLYLRPLLRLVLVRSFNSVARTMRRATSIVAVSPSYLAWALGYARRPGRAADRVFPLSYTMYEPDEGEIAASDCRLRQTLNITPDIDVITFIGQFGDSYDVETIVEAAGRFAQRGDTRVRFILAGDGNKNAVLRAAARSLPNVSFTGWVDQVTALALLRLSTVGLVAYAAHAPQSLPYKVFDYMAAGLPVVSSLRGDFDEIIVRERIGFQYEAGNAESLASAVDRAVGDRHELAQMRDRVTSLFAREYAGRVVYPALVRHLLDVAHVRDGDSAEFVR
jgi:glycosyltransferase involved in cell wall biosynthesis